MSASFPAFLFAAGWGLLALAVICWLLATEPRPQPAGPAPDPYADEVARFRRELHDWDRP